MKRIVATIKLLGSLELALRGSEELLSSNSKDNYLSCLTYLAHFDGFLAEHLKNYEEKGKGNTNYLSHMICDEFINLMGNELKKKFNDKINETLYYSLILDSTTDVSHFDQLCLLL